MHTHTHVVEVDFNKVELFNLQFLSSTEIGVLADLIQGRPIVAELAEMAETIKSSIEKLARPI